MVLQSDISKIKYVCDGEAKEFAVPFKFFKNADGTAQLKVYYAVNENESILEENVDYTVSGSGDDISAKVVFAEAPDENAKLAILREMPFLQQADYVNGEYVDMEELEGSLDGIYMALQMVGEKLSRAILVDALSDQDAEDFADTLLGYKNAAQKAANEAISAAEELKALVDKIGELVDEINGEII